MTFVFIAQGRLGTTKHSWDDHETLGGECLMETVAGGT
jgi:hypothetical protein